MIVILNRDVKGTGKAGEVVKVSDGYAKYAAAERLCHRGYRRQHQKSGKTERTTSAEKADDKAAAEKVAAALENAKVVIKTKSGEGGKLFGSITSKRHRGGCKRTDRDYPR